jgi:hypothetical protein
VGVKGTKNSLAEFLRGFMKETAKRIPDFVRDHLARLRDVATPPLEEAVPPQRESEHTAILSRGPTLGRLTERRLVELTVKPT